MLVRRVRHPHLRQVPRPVQDRQLLRVAPVRLEPESYPVRGVISECSCVILPGKVS